MSRIGLSVLFVVVVAFLLHRQSQPTVGQLQAETLKAVCDTVQAPSLPAYCKQSKPSFIEKATNALAVGFVCVVIGGVLILVRKRPLSIINF